MIPFLSSLCGELRAKSGSRMADGGGWRAEGGGLRVESGERRCLGATSRPWTQPSGDLARAQVGSRRGASHGGGRAPLNTDEKAGGVIPRGGDSGGSEWAFCTYAAPSWLSFPPFHSGHPFERASITVSNPRTEKLLSGSTLWSQHAGSVTLKKSPGYVFFLKDCYVGVRKARALRLSLHFLGGLKDHYAGVRKSQDPWARPT